MQALIYKCLQPLRNKKKKRWFDAVQYQPCNGQNSELGINLKQRANTADIRLDFNTSLSDSLFFHPFVEHRREWEQSTQYSEGVKGLIYTHVFILKHCTFDTASKHYMS